jgi:hypothetical protein
MNDTVKALNTKGGQSPMETLIWFVGIVVVYFAMQLWILPKLGIST